MEDFATFKYQVWQIQTSKYPNLGVTRRHGSFTQLHCGETSLCGSQIYVWEKNHYLCNFDEIHCVILLFFEFKLVSQTCVINIIKILKVKVGWGL